MFSNTFFTLSILVAKSTYHSAMALDIFSSTLVWNFLLDHSKSLIFESKSSSLILSIICTGCSIINFSSLVDRRLRASRKISLMSWNTCFYLCSLLRTSYCFFLCRASRRILICSKVIVLRSNFGSSITSSRLTSP